MKRGLVFLLLGVVPSLAFSSTDARRVYEGCLWDIADFKFASENRLTTYSEATEDQKKLLRRAEGLAVNTARELADASDPKFEVNTRYIRSALVSRRYGNYGVKVSLADDDIDLNEQNEFAVVFYAVENKPSAESELNPVMMYTSTHFGTDEAEFVLCKFGRR